MPSLFWGFRLTMWYVNLLEGTSKGGLKSGFRLTMWYVNPTR
ncbi:hypothetical protein ACHDL8_002553 [Clostridioides difficile]|nr:hypothetical protein [Clostridioides difficile]MDL0289095.1 hypothetical protein [Clostridioides difficile]